MKLVITHPPTNSLQTEDVTHPLRADLAPLDHFSSMGKFTPFTVSNPATHHHHIHYSPKHFLIASTHSDS